jgi:hypothetical protein
VRENRAAPFGMTGGEVAEKAEEKAKKGEERRRKVRRAVSLPGGNAGLKPGGFISEPGCTDTPVGATANSPCGGENPMHPERAHNEARSPAPAGNTR